MLRHGAGGGRGGGTVAGVQHDAAPGKGGAGAAGAQATGSDVDAATVDGQRRALPYETSMAGVFAAGDVRLGGLKRVAAAVGEGSSVVRHVHEYLALEREAAATRQ